MEEEPGQEARILHHSSDSVSTLVLQAGPLSALGETSDLYKMVTSVPECSTEGCFLPWL